ncbi:MAG: AMP-binding protein [Candidatus Rokubacteria bacterium]|nr:AMP-binding protein [Candidatus Rokubacteria bacterium]
MIASLVELLSAHAEAAAERIALYYFEAAITYGVLEQESDALARGFQELGVRSGDRIAVFLQNEPGAVLAHYAGWKAGAIAVPLNIMFKERELEYHLADSTPAGIVCQDTDAAWVEGVARRHGLQFVITTSPSAYFDPARPLPEVMAAPRKGSADPALDIRAVISRHLGRRLERRDPAPGDVAYLHYTSGTTGPPKGAMITHANILFNARTYRDLCRLAGEDSILATAPLFHITGTIGHIAAACFVGAPMVLLHRFQAAEAIRQIHSRRATFTVGSITAFIAMLESAAFGRQKVASLRKIFSGGAPVSPAVVARWEEATGAYIHNVWGMTETTSPGTWTPLGERAPVDARTGALSVGRPIPGTEVMIVDDTGSPVPAGEVGELTVKGPNVFKGYWRKPEETANAVRDGWLYTGDLATRDEAGWVYWIERKKDMINVSGFKVWPREVEDTLLQHPAVLEVAVVGVPDSYRGETVKAVVVLKSEFKESVTAQLLTDFCRERMAKYKYPRIVEFRDELPKNPQGKVLKYALR